MRLARLRCSGGGAMRLIVCETAVMPRAEVTRKAWARRHFYGEALEVLRGLTIAARRNCLTALSTRANFTIEVATTAAVRSVASGRAAKVCLTTGGPVGQNRASWSTVKGTKNLLGRERTICGPSKEVVYAIARCRSHEVPLRPTYGSRRGAVARRTRLGRTIPGLQRGGRERQGRSPPV